MSKHRHLKVILFDEDHLRKIGVINLSALRIAVLGLVFLICSLVVGLIAIRLTPLKTLLPGYMKESQRAASEEAMMRLDSLTSALRQNEAFLNNIATVLNTDRLPVDSLRTSSHTVLLPSDSLLSASPEEMKFMKMMQNREKYNLSVIAPLAAEGLMFYPLSDEAVFPQASRNAIKAQVMLPAESVISSVADGTVLALFSPGINGRYSILVQHPKNFVSRLSGCGAPLVGEGDRVAGGQAIALAPPSSAGSPAQVTVELWHNGTPLPPYSYVSGHRFEEE